MLIEWLFGLLFVLLVVRFAPGILDRWEERKAQRDVLTNWSQRQEIQEARRAEPTSFLGSD